MIKFPQIKYPIKPNYTNIPDTSELGYVFEDGKINFITRNTAIKYAKNRVLKALHSHSPFERGVGIEGSTIIKEFNGTENQIVFNSNEIDKADFFIHGHPNSSPISSLDFIAMAHTYINTIVAINSNGEYSKLETIPSTWANFLPKTIKEKLYKFEKIIRTNIANLKLVLFLKPKYHEIEKNSYTEFCLFVTEHTNKNKDQLVEKIDKLIAKESPKLEDCPDEIITIFNKSNEIQQRDEKKIFSYIHEFWQKNAAKFGAKYDTNYKDLIK